MSEFAIKEFEKLQRNGVYSISLISDWRKKYTNHYNQVMLNQTVCDTLRTCLLIDNSPCFCYSFHDILFLEIYEKTSELVKYGSREEYCLQELETYSKIKDNEIELKKWVIKNELIGADELFDIGYVCTEKTIEVYMSANFYIRLKSSPGFEIFIDKNEFKNVTEFAYLFFYLFWEKEIYPESEILHRLEKEFKESRPDKLIEIDWDEENWNKD